MTRVGGNRLTAYNWETNASNAGSDYLYENDDYLSASNVSGYPMQQAAQAASDAGASILMTVPIAGGFMTQLAFPQQNPTGIAVDAKNVYWTTGDGSVMKVPLAGGTTAPVAVGRPTPFSAAVDGTSVYWTELFAGNVMKVGK